MPDRPKGILYLVATPIGNLADFSFRAVETFRQVDLIACEDTRHSRPLLERYGISKPLAALHEHNEDAVSSSILDRVERGESVALISDAGTPLINDPGFPLVRMAVERGLSVTPVPGPCALVAALCASGLPSDRFAFEGFPPRSASSRRALLEGLLKATGTLVFYESSHRILAFARDIASVFPADRRIVIARELTKLHETFLRCPVGEAPAWLESDPYMEKGEFVVLLQGAPAAADREELDSEQIRVLEILLAECTVKTSVNLAVKITGARKELIYRKALELTRTKA